MAYMRKNSRRATSRKNSRKQRGGAGIIRTRITGPIGTVVRAADKAVGSTVKRVAHAAQGIIHEGVVVLNGTMQEVGNLGNSTLGAARNVISRKNRKNSRRASRRNSRKNSRKH